MHYYIIIYKIYYHYIYAYIIITFSVAYILCETSKMVRVLYIYDIYMCMYVPICTHTYICTHVCFSISHALFLTRYFPFKTGFFDLCM